MQRIIPLLLILAGESLAIYSEVIAARNINNFYNTFWRMAGVMALAGLLLIGGYMLGMKYLQNIWVVGAVSIASIVIAEPIITYYIFRELPNKGAVIGFILGIAAILCALFVK
jgi:hypothetical protein